MVQAVQPRGLLYTVEVTRASIVESYLSSLVGEGVAKVVEKASESTFSISESGEILFTFCLWKYDNDDPLMKTLKLTDSLMCTLNLSKALYYTSTGFFGFFYDLFFKGVPAADVVMEIPKDPPLPAPKK